MARYDLNGDHRIDDYERMRAAREIETELRFGHKRKKKYKTAAGGGCGKGSFQPNSIRRFKLAAFSYKAACGRGLCDDRLRSGSDYAVQCDHQLFSMINCQETNS